MSKITGRSQQTSSKLPVWWSDLISVRWKRFSSSVSQSVKTKSLLTSSPLRDSSWVLSGPTCQMCKQNINNRFNLLPINQLERMALNFCCSQSVYIRKSCVYTAFFAIQCNYVTAYRFCFCLA